MGVTFASGPVRARRFLASVLFVGAGASMWPAGAPSGEGPHPRVLATRIDDAITPVIADHLREGVGRAEREGYDAYVVELDTPGGLDTSMRDIVQSFLSADVPVVVYVTPSGARAASAGAIITFAASVAAMAPGTVIGAATPVGIEGDDVERKVVNDAAALAESIAEERGRDVEFAVDTVRKGRSAPAREALAIGAVDVVAGSLPELLEAVDGVAVEVGSGERVTLRTAGAGVDRYDLGFFRRILQFLADPNLAFLLLSIGTLGLIYELATPGVGFGGVVGVVALILALFALSVLPVNAVGLLLMAVAAALFVAEVVAPGFAGFAAGGAVLLVLSGIFLFRDASGAEVGMEVVLPVAIVMGAAVAVAGRLALQSRRAPSATTGATRLVGRTLDVRYANGATGQSFVEGAWWNVRSPAGRLEPDQMARVVDVDGLTLVVEPVTGDTPGVVSDQTTGGHDE
jgi:membrane-bound serine protease (ClpP class)